MKRKFNINLDSSLKKAADLFAGLIDNHDKKSSSSSELNDVNIKIIGVYKVNPTKKSIEKAALYHGYEYLLDKKGNYTEKIYQSNFKNLGLVELEAEGNFSIENVQLHTEGTTQVPYLEFYLNDNGTEVSFDPLRDSRILANFKSQSEAFNQLINSDKKRRICFFIHFINPSAQLVINDQVFSIPTLIELPNRLKEFVNYLPVD